MEPAELQKHSRLFSDLLLAAVRTGDRTLIRDYARYLLPARIAAGFQPAELTGFLGALNDIILAEVRTSTRLRILEQEAYDSVTLTLQLVADEVEWAFEQPADEKPSGPVPGEPSPSPRETDAEFEQITAHLNAFYQVPPEETADAE